jgi:hypothetical protein
MTVYRTNNTYVATSTAFTPGATPQDIFTITGSATTNVYVIKMGISTLQTTAGANAFFIAKRSTINTGGTSAAPAIVQYQSTNVAPTATVLQYTVTPVVNGNLIGYAWGGWINSPAVATAGIGSDLFEVDFIDKFGEAMTLLSASEVLGWNFKGAALPPGLSVIAYVVWYEASKT